MLKNITKVLVHRISLIVWLISMLALVTIWYKYSAIDYVAANYRSYFFAYFDVFLSWIVIVFFPLIIAGIVYRSLLFGVKNIKDKPSGILGFFGGIVGVFITGASCCGVSLISLLGLTSALSFLEIFPYHGIELKILGASMLIYAWWDLYRNIEVCKVPSKKYHK